MTHTQPSHYSPQPVKPIRPLTAYHLFFQLEREYLIQNIKAPNDTPTVEDDDRPLGIDIDPDMPARYQNIHLTPVWYASASGKRIKTKESEKKKHHKKVHGKISFHELSKRVTTRWKTLGIDDNETMVYCTKIAKREMDLYREKMKQYKENEVAAAQGAAAQRSLSNGPSNFSFDMGCVDMPIKRRKFNVGELSHPVINPSQNYPHTMQPSYLDNKPSPAYRDVNTTKNSKLEELLALRRQLAALQERDIMEYLHLRHLRRGERLPSLLDNAANMPGRGAAGNSIPVFYDDEFGYF